MGDSKVVGNRVHGLCRVADTDYVHYFIHYQLHELFQAEVCFLAKSTLQPEDVMCMAQLILCQLGEWSELEGLLGLVDGIIMHTI